MDGGNYIKIDRAILEWEWYRNINTCRLFVHMLLKANWKDGRFEGTTVPRGSFVSSYPRLAEEIGLTVNELRTALKHLTATGEITVKAHAKYSVFTVNQYCKYQDINRQITGDSQSDNTQGTGKAHSINTLLTTIEEGKKERREEGKKGRKEKVAFVPPTAEEVEAYCQERGNGITGEEFCDYYISKDWMVGKNKMIDWKAAVRTWERNKNKRANNSTGSGDTFRAMLEGGIFG